jgi:Tim10/DDP family zinc finger
MTDPAAALQSLSPEQKQAVIMQVQQQANQQVMQEMMKNMATTCFEACAGTSVCRTHAPADGLLSVKVVKFLKLGVSMSEVPSLILI